VHFIELEDTYVKKTLCYPRSECPDYYKRLSCLLGDGFIYLLETGSLILGSRFLGKGYSAVVVAAKNTRYGLGALKILRCDSRRSSLLGEAEIMLRARDSGLVPRLYIYRDFYIFQELLSPCSCKPLSLILEQLIMRNRVEEVKSVLTYTLRLLFKLDCMRVDHGELNRPGGHLFYCNDGRVLAIDWESARVVSKPVNLTSFISYLVFRFKHRDILGKILNWRISDILQSLKVYKSTYSDSEFNKILSVLRLDK